MSDTHEVVVGNVGTVYSGTSSKEARLKYVEYVAQSKTGRGRAGCEPVTWLWRGDIYREHEGNLHDWEDRPGDE
jgi:hypothetical protein